jgi:hypothetical protein
MVAWRSILTDSYHVVINYGLAYARMNWIAEAKGQGFLQQLELARRPRGPVLYEALGE